MTIYRQLQHDAKAGKKKFAILVDPDKNNLQGIKRITALANAAGTDYFFMGGSLLLHDSMSRFIAYIRENSKIPVILFPGNNLQLNDKANGILLLSLISGRNPELLIGRHVISAPFLKKSKLEILPTGYLLIDGGNTTAVAYMSNTTPIPANKGEIAVCTAMAGEMLGMKLIYMDAGSGALLPIPPTLIEQVKSQIHLPLIIGGGITTPELARSAAKAGADVIVVGNAIEEDPQRIARMAQTVHGS